MEKSEIYYEAMRAVIRAGIHDEKEIIEILDVLQGDRNLALYVEREEKRNAESV